MDLKNTTSSDQVVRVSFGWLLAGVVGVFVVGLLGGFVGQQVRPARAPLSVLEGDNRLISTVQEVTISPNTSAERLVGAAHRSVVLIGPEDPEQGAAFASGVVVTNDGLVVTVDTLPDVPLVAYDDRGQVLDLSAVGGDALFGLTFLRIEGGLLPPLDLRSGAVPVAYQLIAVSRSDITQSTRIAYYPVHEVVLPPELAGRGIQRLLRGLTIQDEQLAGSPLIDEEGKLAALFINPAAGLALPADELRQSLDRVSSGKREVNPLVDAGLTARYRFIHLPGGAGSRFALEVIAVANESPAAQAKLARGDFIVQIGNQPLEWNRSILDMLSGPRPLNVTVLRGEREVTVQLAAPGT